MMENNRIFPKSQLNGKIVKIRMGKYAVVLNGELLGETEGISSLCFYDDNLRDKDKDTKYDIVGVYEANAIYGGSIITRLNGKGLTLLWEEDTWTKHIGEKVIVRSNIFDGPHRGYLHDYVPTDVFPFKVLMAPGDDFLGIPPTIKSYSICELFEEE